MIYQIVDWVATYIECFLCISVVVYVSGRKLERHKHFLALVLCIFGNFFLVAFVNSIQSFSFITPLLSIVYLLCVSYFLARGKLILRAASCIMVLFVILAIGYIWMVFVCFLYGGNFENAFWNFMKQGPLRCLY